MFIVRTRHKRPHSFRSAMSVRKGFVIPWINIALLTECGALFSAISINISPLRGTDF
jgi:hypothetical protein